jgi:transglutaminase-like putative cysteine protease
MNAATTQTEMTSQQWSMTVTPVVAALTTLGASTAMSGVIEGLRWLGYAGVAVIVVTATGMGLRAVRTPVVVVAFAQMFAVLCLLVALFTNSGILGLLPGPAAVSELGDVLRRSVEVVRTGVPPVDATAAVLCLVVIAIGLVAVLVDTLAVAAGTPAACGLVLLCVYAVPASLAEEMLPWWSFVLGAGSFAVLLAVDGAHRHQQWRNRPALPGTGAGVGSPTAHVTAALVLALIAGGTITAIGTVGQLPGGPGTGGAGGLGLKPFTQLRGMLDQGDHRELFRVRGLGQEGRYMRAITLPVYDANGGWSPPPAMPRGDSANRDLRLPPGTRPPEQTTRVEIETISYEDFYAGVYGIPLRVRGLPQGMRYDPNSGMVYSDTKRRLGTYVEEVDLGQPTAADLREAGVDYSEIDDIYTRGDNIDPEIVELAEQITAGQTNPYDKAIALTKYFGPTNGFTYQLKTATGNDEDALEDFLFRSKAGFCEQYASAMAILARAAGLPSRVAIGYTGGFPTSDFRTITTQDAHAWVEIYFPGQGWVMFDPTPLTDARTYTPPYATSSDSSLPTDDPSVATTTPDSPTGAPSPLDPDRNDPENPAGAPDAAQPDQSPAWIGWTTGAFALLALLLSLLAILAVTGALPGRWAAGRRVLIPFAVICWLLSVVLAAALVSWWLSALIVALTAAAAPGFVRQWQRRARRHTVHRNEPPAASAAWQELLAESVDRGAELVPAETVRMTARRLAHEHELDEDGKRALRTVVGAVERSWYSSRPAPDPNLPPAFDDLVAGLRRTSPLALRARLLPRSVLRRRSRPRDNGSGSGSG